MVFSAETFLEDLELLQGGTLDASNGFHKPDAFFQVSHLYLLARWVEPSTLQLPLLVIKAKAVTIPLPYSTQTLLLVSPKSEMLL